MDNQNEYLILFYYRNFVYFEKINFILLILKKDGQLFEYVHLIDYIQAPELCSCLPHNITKLM